MGKTKKELIESWLSQEKRSSEDVKQLINFLEGNDNKSKIAQFWFSASKEKSLEVLLQLLPFVERNIHRSEMVKSFIDSSQNNFIACAKEDVKQLITFVEGNDNKSKIVKSWLSTSEETTLEDLQFFIPFVEDDDNKSKIAQFWFSASKEKSLEVLLQLLPFVKRDTHRSEMVKSFIDSSQNNFIACAKEGLIGRNVYDLENIALRYSDSSLSASDFPNVARKIYPENTDLQSELLIEGIHQFSKEKLTNAKGNIFSFIKDIPNGDRALEVIGVLDAKINLSLQEILSLADGHLSQTYESIGNTLKDYSVATGSDQAVINYFNQTFPDTKPEETNLVSLFSFCVELSDQTDQFKHSLKPEVLQKIRENFTPSSNKVLIKEKDFDNINKLLEDPNSSISSPITNSGILSVTLISEALSQINLSNYPIEKIDQFSFGSNNLFNSISNQEESQKFTNLTKEFRALLKKEPATNDQVASFFEKLLSLDGQISENERGSLGEFFNRDKFLLANLLNKDGGIDKFSALITTAGDGCFANIGTHARLAVVDSLDLSLNLKAIISVFNQHISNPALSSPDVGVDHPIEGSNASTIFTDSRVNKKYISPIAFTNKLKEEFFKDGKKVRDSWEIIRNHYGKNSDGDDVFDDNHIEALVNIGQNHTESLAADLATLFILKESIHELLENKHLQEFKNKTESLKRAIEEKAETKEKNFEARGANETQNSKTSPTINPTSKQPAEKLANSKNEEKSLSQN